VSQTDFMRKPSSGALIAAIILAVVILAVWVALVSTLSSLGDSDPAGNGLAQAFAGFEIILLWILLAILLVIAGVQGPMLWQGIAAAVVLLPASGFAAAVSLWLLADRASPPFLWPIVLPVAVPPLVVAFGFWTLLAPLRAVVSAPVMLGSAWGITLLLCAAMWPLSAVRDHAVRLDLQAQAKWAADFAALPPDAALWQWTPFLQTRDDTRADDVLRRIGKLDRRQADAELMLDRGDFPLRYLGFMNLEPTPTVCDRARALLRRRVQPLILRIQGSRPYADVAEEVEGALGAMRWLTDHGCACNAEAQAWETMANGYSDTNFDVVELKRLSE
jgi:hypothetical protein